MSPTLDSVTETRSIAAMREALQPDAAGMELHDRIRRLYPICRSITGDGVRQTLSILAEEIPLTVEEIPTGTPAYDWIVPNEWNIRDAYIKDAAGVRIVDFRASNLHVVGYSRPVHAFLSLSELRAHLHSIPDHPDWIPYKTSYWSETWGFCVPDRLLQSLPEGQYEVCIDASLEPGHLTWGQCVLEGRETDEVLISCHICHPSLCNDNLSSISIATTLARLLASAPRHYTYRFLFIPATIGAITWLSRHEDVVARIRHGLVLACLGDRGQSTYKRSRRGNALIDRAVVHVLQHSGAAFSIKDFSPYGYDERQYCSPGFNLPVGLLSRTPHGCFPEYHTSADDLECVDPHSLADSLAKILNVVEVLEGDRIYLNRNPKGEPRLGKRGLFGSMGGHGAGREVESALLWVLNFSDGEHSLLDIAERSGISFSAIRAAADALLRCDLLAARIDPDRGNR
jgi:aminopeptidase-like protein